MVTFQFYRVISFDVTDFFDSWIVFSVNINYKAYTKKKSFKSYKGSYKFN